MDALIAMKKQYGEKGYLAYGFVDSFDPSKNWYNPDVIGIDVGPTVLMAENLRTGGVWSTFMKTAVAQKGMKAAGFRPIIASDEASPVTSLFATEAGH